MNECPRPRSVVSFPGDEEPSTATCRRIAVPRTSITECSTHRHSSRPSPTRPAEPTLDSSWHSVCSRCRGGAYRICSDHHREEQQRRTAGPLDRGAALARDPSRGRPTGSLPARVLLVRFTGDAISLQSISDVARCRTFASGTLDKVGSPHDLLAMADLIPDPSVRAALINEMDATALYLQACEAGAGWAMQRTHCTFTPWWLNVGWSSSNSCLRAESNEPRSPKALGQLVDLRHPVRRRVDGVRCNLGLFRDGADSPDHLAGRWGFLLVWPRQCRPRWILCPIPRCVRSRSCFYPPVVRGLEHLTPGIRRVYWLCARAVLQRRVE